MLLLPPKGECAISGFLNLGCSFSLSLNKPETRGFLTLPPGSSALVKSSFFFPSQQFLKCGLSVNSLFSPQFLMSSFYPIRLLAMIQLNPPPPHSPVTCGCHASERSLSSSSSSASSPRSLCSICRHSLPSPSRNPVPS